MTWPEPLITTNHALNRTWAMGAGSVAELQTISWMSTAMKTFFAIFSRIGVPIFLMISGALLLKKPLDTGKEIKKFYKHNLLSLLATSEIWLFIMYWFILLVKPGNTVLETQGMGAAVLGMVKTMLFVDQVTLGSMWYIPMILAVYTVIPLFAIALQHVDDKRFLLAPAAIVFLQGMLVPNLNAFFGLMGMDISLSMNLKAYYVFSVYMLFVLAGYAVSQGALGKIPSPVIYLSAAGSFLLLCGYQLFAFSREYVYLVDYSSSGLLVCSVLVFESIRRFADRLQFMKKPVTYLSKISFGIYFIHIIIMESLFWKADLSWMSNPGHFLFLEGVSVGGSILIIWLLSHVKVCRRYLFMIKS